MRLDDAADVFCRSFAFTRSFTHPFEFVRLGDLRLLRDATPKREPRAQEIVVCEADPGKVLLQIESYDPPRHFLCVICSESSAGQLKAAYKAGGYRMMGSEDFFVRDLSGSIEPAGHEVRRVTTKEEAERIAKAARTRQIPLDRLESSEVRLYCAWLDDEPAGWVRSIHLEPDSAWASNLYVRPEYRRRGFGSALMTKMLEDDRAAGARNAVLLASRVGSYLYPQIGYEKIGVLLMFSPKR